MRCDYTVVAEGGGTIFALYWQGNQPGMSAHPVPMTRRRAQSLCENASRGTRRNVYHFEVVTTEEYYRRREVHRIARQLFGEHL